MIVVDDIMHHPAAGAWIFMHFQLLIIGEELGLMTSLLLFAFIALSPFSSYKIFWVILTWNLFFFNFFILIKEQFKVHPSFGVYKH